MSLRIHLALLFILFTTLSFAQTPLKVTTKNLSVPATGMDLDVEIRFSDFVDITGGNVIMLWDSTVMVIDTVPFLDGTAIPGIQVSLPQNNNVNPEQGQAKLNWFSSTGQNLPDSTHIATLRFNVLGQPCDTTSFRLGDIGPNESQRTEVLNSSFLNIGADIEGPIVEIPGTNCNVFTPDPVGFDLLNVTTMSGSNICIPLVVTGFDSIDSFQGSLAWNPAQLNYTGVQSFGVAGFSSSDFNTLQAGMGSLTYTWIDNSGTNPETLSDGSALFEVCFDASAGPGTTSQVDITNTPTNIIVTRAQPDPSNPNSIFLNFTTDPGLVTIPQVAMPDPVGFSMPNLSGNLGGTVCVPINVTNFINITSASASIAWDNTIAEFVEVQNFGLNNFTLNNINANAAGTGSLGFTWTDITNNAPATLPNGASLMDVCFELVGAEGSSTDLDFTSTPFAITATQENPTPGQPPVNLQTTVNSGSLSVNAPVLPGVTFTLPNVSGNNGDSECIPLTADGFNNINSFNGSVMWDPAIMTFTNLTNINLSGGIPAGTLNTMTAGMVGFSWFDQTGSSAVTLPSGGTVFELCFDIIGNQNDVSTLKMVDTPTAISVSEQPADPTLPSVELDYSLENGSYTVINGPGGGTSSDVLLTVGNASGNCGDNICVPLTAVDFTNINSFDGSIMWSASELEYTGLSNVALTGGISPGDINDTQASNGMLGWAWFDQTGSTPTTLANGETVLEICFNVVGENSNNSSTIKMADTPTSISLSAQPANPSDPSIPLDYTTVDGSFIVGTACTPSGGGTDVILTLGDASGSCGDNVCVPITVANFTDINSFDGSIMWSATELEYTGLSNVALTGGISPGDINDTQASNGMLGWAWFDQTGSTPTTLADGATAFEICFDVVGTSSNTSFTVKMADTPTGISLSAQPANPSDPSIPLDFTLVDGSFSISTGCMPGGGGDGDVGFIFQDVCVTPNENSVCVPLVVTDFTNVSQLDFSVMWDPAIIEFDEIDDVILTGFSTSFLNTTQADDGMLSFVWFDDTGANPETFADSTIIAEFCFDVLGGNGDSSNIKMYDGQSDGLTDIAVGIAGATPSDPVMPGTYTLQDGTVTIGPKNPGDFDLSVGEPVITNSSQPVCVPLQVTNFNNIIITEWNIQYDPTQLCYREITNINPNVPSLNSNFIDNTTPGIVKLAWSDPNRVGRTIPNGDTYFEICFDPKLSCPSNNVAVVSVLVDPANAAFFEVVNQTNQTTPLTYTSSNGSVTLDCGIVGDPPNIVDSDVVDIRCNDDANGSISVDFTGGGVNSNCSWLGPNGFSMMFAGCNGITSISNLQDPGSYVLLITNTAGSATQTFTLSEPTAININATVTNVNCDAQGNIILGNISVNPSGGTGPYTVCPDNLNNINVGQYRVEVKDARGCSTTQFYEVIDICPGPVDPTCSAIVGSHSNCGRGGTIDVTATGGRPPYTTSYSPPIPSVDNIPPGTYCVTVTDANGNTCKTNQVTVLDITQPLNAVISNIMPGNSCTRVGGSADIQIVGGCEPYSCTIGLIGSAGFDCSRSNNILPGLYYLRIRDNNNNEYDTQFTIPDSPIDPVTTSIVEVLDPVSCSYNPGRVTFSAQGGCPPYLVSITNTVDPSIVVASGAGFEYNLPAGTYRATISDSNGANQQFSEEEFTIGNGPEPIIVAGQPEDVDSCDIRVPFSGGTPPYSYEWFDTSNELVSTAETLDLTDIAMSLCDTTSISNDYTIIVTDAAECVFNFSQSITCNGLLPCSGVADSTLSVTELVGDLLDCAEDCNGTITGIINQSPSAGPYTITVSDQAGNDSSIIQNDVGPFTFPNLCASSYTLMITDINGTDWFLGSNVPVTAPEPIAISLVESTCENDKGVLEVGFTGGTGNYTLEWMYLGQSFSNDPRIIDLEDGSYFVEVADGIGCVTSRVYDVMCDTIVPDCNVFDGIPVITPNQDGVNDLLYINCADTVDSNELRIYDRWGRLVYSVADYNNDWAGVDNNGELLGEGAYYWILRIPGDNSDRIEKGTVTLLRNQ